MAIEFHCNHCNHQIKAPDEAAGRQGKCPHCNGVNYVPRPMTPDEGELDLAPLDDEEEKKRQKASREDAAYQWKLLHEKSIPGDMPGKGVKRASTGASSAPPPPSRHIASLIVRFVESMSGGKLQQADEVANQLAGHRMQAMSMLDEMAAEDLTAYGFPTLPRPVLQGFLKQLRGRL
ncbi:MAG TPA: hypothetical protein VJZ71_03570 [Phycisphaerae bacterium]|nr:hypothetical protein [Phycisphaerae bacterium]